MGWERTRLLVHNFQQERQTASAHTHHLDNSIPHRKDQMDLDFLCCCSKNLEYRRHNLARLVSRSRC
jgi:hypothetical protein